MLRDNDIFDSMNLAFDHLRHHVTDNDLVVLMNASDRFVKCELVGHLTAYAAERPELRVAGVRLTCEGPTIEKRHAPAPMLDPSAIIYRGYLGHQATFYSARFLNRKWVRREFLYWKNLHTCADLEQYLAAREEPLLTTPFTGARYAETGCSSKLSQASRRRNRDYCVSTGNAALATVRPSSAATPRQRPQPSIISTISP